MSEEDEIIWADGSSRKLLTWVQTHIDCTVQYDYQGKHSMSDEDANRIPRGIVWQSAYGAWHTHFLIG